MKLQVSFDLTNLDKAIEIATKIGNFADVFEIGTILIYKHGINALEKFRETFPQKTLLADTKIVDRGKEIVPELAKTGIDWITVMAGTTPNVIHATCTEAKNNNLKVMLDLLDSSSPGQSAMEAKNLGADALLFHEPYDEQESTIFLDKWDMVKGNTSLPIFVSAKIKRETIEEIIKLHPHGLVIGKSITEAANPAAEAQFFYELCSKN